MAEVLMGQEQASVSSYKSGWLEGEMTEQENVPASLGDVSLGTRSILEMCS